MLKQSSNGMKKVLAIFMAVLFGVSLTAVAVSAEPSVVKDKKIVVNSETNKNMNMKEHGYEGHGHGYEEHRHEEHGYGY
jgi:hypothetical protein